MSDHKPHEYFKLYKPKWNEKTSKYNDVCPFEKRKSGKYIICNCRKKEDKFKNMSEFKRHISHNYHKRFIENYDLIYENKKLKREIMSINKILKSYI